MITVFTPTYNRAYTLERLYRSLLSQTDKNFEWVIVDDGSTDGTEELIKKYICENKIDIIYEKKINGGKMSAINRGVFIAHGELFFIVDSDDYLENDAIEIINRYLKDLPSGFAGLVFRKRNIRGKDFGKFPDDIIDSNPVDIFYKRKVLGDKAEIVKTEILKKYLFPLQENEKFIPEGVIWNRIGRNYNFRYIDRVIYNFEYIADGYTQNFSKIMRDNPRGMKLYYGEILQEDIPLKNKVKFVLRYIQSCCY
ncbi:MAG: glycosyltransferase family A protein, partial [Fusobacteriaceae bacterium]